MTYKELIYFLLFGTLIAVAPIVPSMPQKVEKSMTAQYANQILRVNESKRAAAETIYGLGRLYETDSEPVKARDYYKEAFELYPGYTEARDAYFRLDAQLNSK